MNLRIPKGEALVLFVLSAIALVLFMYLMGRFGGPSLRFSDPYSVSAVVPDTQGLAVKSDVLVRGVKVGEISEIERSGGSTTVRFELQDRYSPVRSDATVRVGQKTMLGEAYVDLEPGDTRAPEIPSGERIERVVPSVELDEALAPLVEHGGRPVRSMLDTFARGARSDQATARFNETLGEIRPLVTRLRRLATLLDGQAGDIASGVRDTRTVLAELGSRESSVRSIVSGGRATLDAMASQRSSLEAGLAELPALLAAGRNTLDVANPLLVEARPLLADLRAASPELTPALKDLEPIARDTRRLLTDVPDFNSEALPFLDKLDPVISAARPVARGLEPALANIVTAVGYLEPRKNAIAAWFANTNDLGLNGDDTGKWARFFLFMENGTANGAQGGKFSNNAYTQPDDAEDNQPYEPGDYPRLMPFTP